MNDVILKMHDGKLSDTELSLRIAEFERDGKLIEFSGGVVNMVEQYLKSENKHNHVLASQVQTMNQILIDKDRPFAEKQLAHQKLHAINQELRKKSEDNTLLIVGVVLLIGIIIGVAICSCNTDNK